MKKYILLPFAAIIFLIAGCEKLGLKGEDGANGATIIG
jgi:hypothetical protein